MTLQPNREYSPYNSIDYYWPIQTEVDSSGQPIKLLIKEQFYDFAEPVYDIYKRCSEFYTVVDEGTNLPKQLELPKIPELSIELGSLGITVFVIRLLVSAVIWAARRGIELSKFKLHTGGWGSCNIGWTPMGGVLYKEC